MKCPICGNQTAWKDNPDRPFCSERCRVIDLGNWASGDYRVPVLVPDVDEKVDPHEDQPVGESEVRWR